MQKLITFAKSLAADVVIFGVACLIIISIPALKGISISVHSWAWAILLIYAVIFTAVQGFLKGFFGAIVKDMRLRLNNTAAAFLDKVVDWILFALAFFATAAAMPTRASYSSAPAILALAVIIGIASAASDLVTARIKAKKG